MSEKLGIAVTTRDHMCHVLDLAKAAKRAGKTTEIFLAGEGVCLTHDPRFPELLEVAKVGVCEASYIANGFGEKPVPGLLDKDYVTQARNAEIVEASDRYLIL